jgi:transglutaminase-like putative cysteine protease
VYLPGWGWLDLDPTNDIVGCEEHITTAWGRDYLDVSPVRGSVIGGGRAHDLEVTVEVSRLVH